MWLQLKVKALGKGEFDKPVSKPRALLSYIVYSLKSNCKILLKKSDEVKTHHGTGNERRGKENILKN